MNEKLQKYWFLFIFILLSITIIPFFLPSGGITEDSIYYFGLADSLPEVKHNLFPIGYPILIKIVNIFTHDYFYSSKILSTLGVILIGVFSYYKKFYFKETVLLLTIRIFLILYTYSYSESVFLTLMYFLIYYFHEYFSGKIKGIHFIVPASLLMMYMVMVRYSGIYVYISISLYFLFHTIRNYHISSILYKSYFYFLLLSATGITAYLAFNYSVFHSFFGENIRLKPDINHFWAFTYENLLGVINVVNPVFSIKILNLKNNLSLIIEIAIIIIDLLFLTFFIFSYKKYFKRQLTPFHQLLLTIGGVYLVLMFLSEYKQGIEYLNTRMLCETSFVLFFSFLILFYKQFPTKTNWLFLICCISMFYNMLYLMKAPANYLSNKAKVEHILELRTEVKYFYNDTKDQQIVSIYTIPFTNKKIEHIHPYLQSGDINFNIIGTIKPTIKMIKEDDLVINKKLILYNSEIK